MWSVCGPPLSPKFTQVFSPMLPNTWILNPTTTQILIPRTTRNNLKGCQQELRPRGPSAMLPLNPILKGGFEKFEHDFLASNLPEGKYIKPLASTANYYKVQRWFEDKLQELNTDFAKICISPKPSGPLWARFPYKFSRNLNTKLGRTSLPSISQLLMLRLPLLVTLLWRSVSTVAKQS